MRKQHHDIIVFGEDWGGLPSSTQHLISHLAKYRKIVWVNSIGLRQPKFTWHDIKRVWMKIFSRTVTTSCQSNREGNEINNIFVINPRTLPAPKSYIARWIARTLLIFQIKPVIRFNNLHSPILWTSLPTAVDLAGYLDEYALVYYCGDDFSSLSGVDHATVSSRERELVNKAHLILAASESLEKRFPSQKTRLLPHGVDYGLFSTPVNRANDLPDNGQPTAGYYGSISEWFNVELLHDTIKCLPHWNFVFIGKIECDVSTLMKFNNVSFLGSKPHNTLASYCQHWSASLLPFYDNPQIQACNPLKLREYLAAGTPIISTYFPAISEYSQVIYIANNANSMVNALEQSIKDNNHKIRQAAVRHHTWEARAIQASTWMDLL